MPIPPATDHAEQILANQAKRTKWDSNFVPSPHNKEPIQTINGIQRRVSTLEVYG